jgi:hypothetical protein
MCPTACTSDNDCASQCPSVPGGQSNCCDVQTSQCYIINSTSCPAPNGSATSTTGAGY